MLRKCAIAAGLFLMVFSVFSQNIQERYQKHYFSEELGFEIDTFFNPALYNAVIDWLTTKYRYGGDSQHGIDCSGFVKAVYDSAYRISLEGGSGNIYQHVTPVEKENLREGDLVFFKIRKKRISHVGIYLGKNKFVHASRAIGVTVSDLDDPYYKRYYYSAGRHKNVSETVLSYDRNENPAAR
jgi:murein DD-endopeptidase / murein LD-carboxypeptidase